MDGCRTIDSDLCVIGAGIVGLAHAHEAVARGLRVTVLERGDRAVGASVRNFGHCFVSAMNGRALECALQARERWLELGRRAGLTLSQAGSVIVARHEDELAVMESFTQDERRRARMITAEEVAALVPVPVDRSVGGVHAEIDLRVDPRAAVAGLAALLPNGVVWNAPVQTIEPGLVRGLGVEVRAPLVIVCPGADFDALPAALQPRREGLTRCKLQMLRVASPHDRAFAPALLTGLSLLRYPGFSAQPGIGHVRERLEAERPELMARGIHLIVTQLPGGDLIIGDTHEYGMTVSPFGDEQLDRLLLTEAQALLGAPRLEVRERWQGVYPYAPGDPFLVTAPLPGVRVVEVVAGIGMTTALGLAPLVLDEITQPRQGGRGWGLVAPPLSGAARAGCES